MRPGDGIFLAVAFVLIFAYTAWNIAYVRRRARLYRKLQEILEQQKKEQRGDEEPASHTN